ncbi:MAG: HAMP domain-containing histidine kinase [Ignavibacteriales bacterium]|nr:HAMP domain-containing histidine kinase [Ignavibacteriales bacterium]
MKEKRLKLIIIFLTTAIIGLIFIQLYWIVNSVTLEKEKFQARVIDALHFIADRIEKEETAEIILRKGLPPDKLPPHIIHWQDKVPKLFDTNNNFEKYSVYVDSLKSNQKFHFRFEYEDSTRDRNKIYVTDNIIRSDSSFRKIVVDNSKIIRERQIIPRKEDYRVERIFVDTNIDTFTIHKEKIFDEVIDELIFIREEYSISERIESERLEDIIDSEFKNRGIPLDYNFGIESLDKDSMIICNDSNAVDELTSSNYKVRLFPAEVFRKPDFLIVQFPNETGYLLRTISWMLIISIFVIAVIVYLIIKTVQMLIKQKKISEMKNDLINNITHEFKTPVSTISLACDAISEKYSTKDKYSVERYTKMIKEENTKLVNLIDSLLNTALLENGNFSLKKKEVDVHKLISGVVHKYEMVIKERDGNISTEFQATDNNILCDEMHISNVLNNLIDNAIKYTSSKPEIKITTRSENEYIVVSIKDNGIGIPTSDKEKIFDTFYRVHTGNIHNVKGYGIGLSYVKKIIESHGGKIELKSKVNEGSCFEIFLPLLK